MELTHWAHRQVVFVLWLVAGALLYALGGLAYSIPLICVFAVYELVLMRWVAKKRSAQS